MAVRYEVLYYALLLLQCLDGRDTFPSHMHRISIASCILCVAIPIFRTEPLLSIIIHAAVSTNIPFALT